MVCFGRAVGAKDETEKSAVQEELQLAVLSSMAENNGKFNASSAATEITTTLSGATASANTTANTLTGNYKGYNYSVDANGTVTITASSSSGGGETTGTLASEVLHVDLTGATDSEISQYVLYEDKNGDDMLCRVLYSDGGTIEIVSVDAIDTVTLGFNDPTIPSSADGYNFSESNENLDFEKARWSYNNAITTLNNKADSYRNTALSDRARCIGSNPTTPSSQSGSYTFPEGYTTPTGYSEMPNLLDADENYNTDYTRLQAIGADELRDSGAYYRGNSNSDRYWLASHNVDSYSYDSDFIVRFVYANGGLGGNSLYGVYSEGKVGGYGFSPSCGFRPVFRLASGVKVAEGGDGTIDHPYVLVAP